MDESRRGGTSALKGEMAESVFVQGIKRALNAQELVKRIEKAAELKRQYLEQLKAKIEQREKSSTYLKEIEVEVKFPYGLQEENDSRMWLKDVFVEEDDVERGSEEEITEEEYRDMLKMHKRKKKCAINLTQDPSLGRFMHYSSDFINNEDKWKLHKKSFKNVKRKKRPKVEIKSEVYDPQDGADESVLQIDESFPQNSGKISQPAPPKKKKINIDAIRKRHWKMIAKKDIPKAYRVRTQVRSCNLAMLRRVSREGMKKQRANTAVSMKISKDKAGRARRITREMQLFWKKYSKVEKVHRKKAEKHALEQIRLDEEMREAKRQQRKLNFLISQTELFAHFISKKLSKTQDGMEYDERIKSILDTLEKDYAENEPNVTACDEIQSSSDMDDHEGSYYCDKAMKNVKHALERQRSQTAAFDSHDAKSSVSNILSDTSALSNEELPQPSLFKGSLKSYQLKGMNWLINLYEQGINGILADEMGLGKTVQSIAFLGHLAEKINIWGPFLIVAPASTLNNWHQEFTKFFPDFKVLPYWGNPTDRKVLRKFWNQKASYHSDKNSAPFHVLVTSYQLVISDVRYFQRIKWQYMVLDEAQALKSTSSQRWKILLEFNCRNRLLLTGTPIQNTMAELWALLHFIMPSLFDSHTEFNEWFSKDIENHIENKSNMDETQLSRLHMILKPFMLRRIKRDVENELSEKIEVRVHCSLAPRQRALYDAIKKNIKLEDLLKSAGSTYISTGSGNTLMNLVMQFRKVCNHPDLFERREVLSPLHLDPLPPYSLPKLIYRKGILSRTSPGKRKLLYCDLNIHNPLNLHLLLNSEHGSGFSFFSLLPSISSCYWKIIRRGIQYLWILCQKVRSKKKSKYFQEIFFESDDHEDGYNRHSINLESLVTDMSTLHLFAPSSPFGQLVFVKYCSNKYEHAQTQVVVKPEDGGVVHLLDELELLSIPHCLEALYTSAVRVPARQIYFCDTNACNEFSRPVFGAMTSSLLFGASEGGEMHNDFCTITYTRQTVFSKQLSTGKGLNALSLAHGWSNIRIPEKEYLVTDSGKLYALDILLRRLKSEDHRVLIYSQMTRMIDILEEYMWYRQHTYIRLDGSSRISERRDMVADFQSRSDIFAFLLSTRAGGLGINLTAADTVIFYDSDWNPTVDQQAMDRAHRLGQTKQVTVYRLVCQGTVDERILQRAEEKNAIQRMVIAGGSFRPDTLKTKEVVSLLLDDEQLIQRLKMKRDENKGELLPYKGKKRGRKTNAEREAKRLKQLQEQGVTGAIADSNSGHVTIIHSESNSPAGSDLFESRFLSGLDGDSESGFFFDSAPASPASEISAGSDLKIVEDDQIIVDDYPADSPLQNPTRGIYKRGRGGGRGRGRPRIRPLVPEGPKRGRRLVTNRGATRVRRASRVRRMFTGRAAAMAGARAGAVAASAATFATYGYGLEPTSSMIQQQKDGRNVPNSSSAT